MLQNHGEHREVCMRPSFLQSLQDEIESRYAGLTIVTDGKVTSAVGTLPIYGDSGEILDVYQIELSVARDNRKHLPVLKEVGGRIPRNLDRHVTSDGAACLFARDSSWKYWNEETRLQEFIDGPVTSFLLGQTFYESFGYFPFGERSHYGQGLLEYYFEELSTENIEVVHKFLIQLLSKRIHPYEPCYCLSMKPLKFCHWGKLCFLRGKINASYAISTYRFVKALRIRQQLIRRCVLRIVSKRFGGRKLNGLKKLMGCAKTLATGYCSENFLTPLKLV